jgi:hypothetical protein
MIKKVVELNSGKTVGVYRFDIEENQHGRITSEFGIGSYYKEKFKKIERKISKEEIEQKMCTGKITKGSDGLYEIVYVDQLILSSNDIVKLEQLLPNPYIFRKIQQIDAAFWDTPEEFVTEKMLIDLHNTLSKLLIPQWKFWLMINDYIQFMSKNKQEEYIFEGPK